MTPVRAAPVTVDTYTEPMAEESLGARRSRISKIPKVSTRVRLRESAFVLFAENGYLQTTVEDITRHLGVSRATFYLHFSGKSEIVREFYEDEWMPRAVALYGALDDVVREGGGRPALRVWIDEAVSFHESYRAWLPFLEVAGVVEPELRRLRAELRSRCVAAMSSHLGRSEGAEAEVARVKLEMVMTQLHRYCLNEALGQWSLERTRALDVLTETWELGLSLPGPTRAAPAGDRGGSTEGGRNDDGV